MNKQRGTFFSDIFTPEIVEYYQKNIIAFVEDIIFKGDPSYKLSSQQMDFLLAIQNFDRVAAKSGKGVGKTASVTYAVYWFMCCFPPAKVICTAPTFPTLKTALWPEMAMWLNRSAIKNIFEHTEKKLYAVENPKYWFAEPRTAKDQSSAQGAHAENMLIIVDEASGIREEIFEAYDTTLTSKNNKFVLIGNPIRVSGPFYDAFNKYRHKWKTLTFNAEESPIVKPEQIEYYAEKYGIHHDLYMVNVKGEFPSGSPDSFLRLSDVHDAVERYDDISSVGEVEIGLDVARFGDDLTVLYWRRGYKVYQPKILPKNTIPEAAQLVLDTVVEIRKTTGYDKRIKVKIDDSGVGGGVVDILKLDREHNIEIVPVNFGGKGDDIYQNEASVMWGNLKSNLKYIGLPEDTKLTEELVSRRWKMSPSGKIMIEPKSDYKKEYKNSPDRADALILCFARKVNEDVILKDFDPLDTSIIKKNLGYAGELNYCNVYYSKDLTASIVYTSWNGNRLYVYDEFIGKDSLIYVSNNIHQHMPLEKITGNEPMFSLKGEDLSSKFRKFGINIIENLFYNEISAIENLSSMITQKKILINERCIKTIDQLTKWKMDKNRYSLDIEFGLCYSLSYIASDIKRKIQNEVTQNPFEPYTGTREKELRNIGNTYQSNNSWMIG
jgi:phage terminase large subunit